MFWPERPIISQVVETVVPDFLIEVQLNDIESSPELIQNFPLPAYPLSFSVWGRYNDSSIGDVIIDVPLIWSELIMPVLPLSVNSTSAAL